MRNSGCGSADKDLFSPLLALYFFSLHADQLRFELAGFTIRLNNLLALALLLFFFLRFRHGAFCMNRALVKALLFLTASLGLSAALSPYKGRCLLFLGHYFFTLLCYGLLPYFLARLWDERLLLRLYWGSFIGVGSYAALQLLASIGGIYDSFAPQLINHKLVRPNAFAFEPSYYALYMTPFVFLYNYHFLADRNYSIFHQSPNNLKKNNLFVLLFINGLYVLSTSFSIVIAYALFLVLLFFSSVPWKKIFLWLLGGLTSLGFLSLVFPSFVKKMMLKFFFSGFMSHHSFYERWFGIKNAWALFLQHPVIGVGLGAYPPVLCDAYLSHDRRFYFLSGYEKGFAQATNCLKLFEPMNVATELLASLGLVGFLAFSLLVGVFVKEVRRAARYEPDKAYGIFLSVFIMCVVLQINQGLFRTYIWVYGALAFAQLESISQSAERLYLQRSQI